METGLEIEILVRDEVCRSASKRDSLAVLNHVGKDKRYFFLRTSQKMLN
jgi:hypothetical protein